MTEREISDVVTVAADWTPADFDADRARRLIDEHNAEAEREFMIADVLRGHADNHDFFARKARDRADFLTGMLAKETTP